MVETELDSMNNDSTKTEGASQCQPISTPVQKTRLVADTEENGNIRHDVFNEVINRYNQAIKDRYYLEAITLIESLLCDRLESVIGRVTKKPVTFMTYGILKSIINKFNNVDLKQIKGLFPKLDDWFQHRNSAIHQMAKISVANPQRSFQEKYNDVEKYAIDGISLFRSLDKAVRRIK